MSYQEQIEQAKRAVEKWRSSNPIVGVGDLRVDLMVYDLTRSITDLLSRAETAERERDEAVHDRMVMEQKTANLVNRAEEAEARAGRLAEELKAHAETDLAKAHEGLSAEWAEQKMRADKAEARAEKAEENFSKSVDALKHEREFAAEEREKREKAEKHLKALSEFALGRPIMITGQREVISFCGIPVEDAMQRVLDYTQLKKRAENAEKTLAELLEKNAKIQANIGDTVCVNVVPSNLYSEHDFYFEMSVKGFCKQCVFAFEDKNYSIEELCKVISKTFTDMLREYEAKYDLREK